MNINEQLLIKIIDEFFISEKLYRRSNLGANQSIYLINKEVGAVQFNLIPNKGIEVVMSFEKKIKYKVILQKNVLRKTMLKLMPYIEHNVNRDFDDLYERIKKNDEGNYYNIYENLIKTILDKQPIRSFQAFISQETKDNTIEFIIKNKHTEKSNRLVVDYRKVETTFGAYFFKAIFQLDAEKEIEDFTNILKYKVIPHDELKDIPVVCSKLHQEKIIIEDIKFIIPPEIDMESILKDEQQISDKENEQNINHFIHELKSTDIKNINVLVNKICLQYELENFNSKPAKKIKI